MLILMLLASNAGPWKAWRLMKLTIIVRWTLGLVCDEKKIFLFCRRYYLSLFYHWRYQFVLKPKLFPRRLNHSGAVQDQPRMGFCYILGAQKFWTNHQLQAKTRALISRSPFPRLSVKWVFVTSLGSKITSGFDEPKSMTGNQ